MSQILHGSRREGQHGRLAQPCRLSHEISTAAEFPKVCTVPHKATHLSVRLELGIARSRNAPATVLACRSRAIGQAQLKLLLEAVVSGAYFGDRRHRQDSNKESTVQLLSVLQLIIRTGSPGRASASQRLLSSGRSLRPAGAAAKGTSRYPPAISGVEFGERRSGATI